MYRFKSTRFSTILFIIFIVTLVSFFDSYRHSKWYLRLTNRQLTMGQNKILSRYDTDINNNNNNNNPRLHKKQGNRRVALWIVREVKDKVAALFFINDKALYQAFEENLNFMETAYNKCEQSLSSMFGLNIEQVEFLKGVKKGPSQYSDNLITYVSLVTNKNAKLMDKALSRNNKTTVYKKFEDLNIELALKKELKYKYNIKQDYPDIREFLHPIIVTAGKDPSKCLGERPSWAKKKKKKFLKHWPRIREKYGFDKA